jgi:hypothetical protein
VAELYCTWSHRSSLSTLLKDQFSDLDYFLTELIASAESRLVMVAPYLSPVGMRIPAKPNADSEGKPNGIPG